MRQEKIKTALKIEMIMNIKCGIPLVFYRKYFYAILDN